MIVDAVTRDLPAGDAERLQVALQLAFGLLVNAVLHDPGPLGLKDDHLAATITGALTPFLTQETTNKI